MNEWGTRGNSTIDNNIIILPSNTSILLYDVEVIDIVAV